MLGGQVCSRVAKPSAPASVRGALQFAKPCTERIGVVVEGPGSGATNGTYHLQRVKMQNLRLAKEDQFGLDTAGFQLISFSPRLSTWDDEQQVKASYYPEVQELLKQYTGAERVVVFDHTIRRRKLNQDGKLLAPKVATPSTREPVLCAHVDYTPISGPERLVTMLGEEAAQLIAEGYRYAIIQVWRPLVGPVQDLPLGFCDAASVNEEKDLLHCNLTYSNRTGSIFMLAHNPEQRWYYAPQMTTDEAFIFKCFDSLEQPGLARFTPHSAFIDPTTPAGAPPRQSIEVRCLVLWRPQ